MAEVALMAEVAEKFPPLPPFRHMLDLLIFTLQVTINYGNVVIHTLDDDTLQTSLCEFPLSPIEEDKGNFSCYSI